MCQQLSHCRSNAFIKSIALDHCGPSGLVSAISHEGHLPSQNGEEPFILPLPSHSRCQSSSQCTTAGGLGAATYLSVCPQCSDCNPREFSVARDPFFLQKCAMQVCALKTEVTAKPPTPNLMTEQNLPGSGSFLIKVIIQMAS